MIEFELTENTIDFDFDTSDIEYELEKNSIDFDLDN